MNEVKTEEEKMDEMKAKEERAISAWQSFAAHKS